MDQVQPHIKISDWYAPCFDCGSEYQICVQLLDQKKTPIKTFQPEKVIFPFRNSQPWCETSHVFKNYGPGVRFIRFTHGGNDTQFWAGHYGIRVTNSSVVIYPADESFSLTNRNLLKNPVAQEGLKGWEIVANGGDRWVTEGNKTTFPVTKCFVTSCGLCLKEQLIDLKKEGYGDALMDQQQPHIKISDWYTTLSDCGSEYQICVELLDEKRKPISTFQPEKVFFQKGTIYPWRQVCRIILTVQLFPCNCQSLTVPVFVLVYFRCSTSLGIMDLEFGLSVSLTVGRIQNFRKANMEYRSLIVVWRSV
uniref:Si:dkey-147f3.4 n=1 Tax=Sinocyclocheilus rhinocerous TaxID=307959 RepID=A0A673GQ05_9TELE